ncbi:hypothetical protein ACFLSQ_03985 [Bacteroidota bacterium]
MLQTYEAIIYANGSIKVLQDIKVAKPARAIITILDDDFDKNSDNNYPLFASEKSLAEDWNKREEDEAWAYLQ